MAKHPKSYRALFVEIAKSKGYKVRKPNYHERKASIDVVLEGQINGKATEVTVDIKKKNGKNANQWVYIEYDNSKGQKGWIYGDCQFIVFETSQEFIFVPRKKLLTFLESSECVRWDLPYVDKPWNSKYRLFRRQGTLETISQIKVSDLFRVEGHKIWKKP
tara:strand:+ start:9528 stop:10010 length:483 start_codon:yes stop_codon:yes gene_type:complete